MRLLVLGALMLAPLLLPVQATAQIYKWTDAQGGVHFGEQPVSGATEVEVKPQVIQRDDVTRQREERTQNFYKARSDEREKAQQQASQAAAEQAKTCSQLRYQLRQMPTGRSYYSIDAKGERVYYTDQQLDAARRQLSGQIAQECE